MLRGSGLKLWVCWFVLFCEEDGWMWGGERGVEVGGRVYIFGGFWIIYMMRMGV